MNGTKLGERALLMQLSLGMPGKHRQNPVLSGEVKSDKEMSQDSGGWVAALYPKHALQAVQKIDDAARSFHDAVTLPFNKGIGILPAALVVEYGDRMREFKGKRQVAIDAFLSKGQEWVNWATDAHNGTFQPELFPGCNPTPIGSHTRLGRKGQMVTINEYAVDGEEFRRVMAERFYFRVDPLPVPESAHFENTVASLLGTDLAAVDARVRDAAKEAAQELMRRMIDPVKAIAEKLVEQPKGDKKDIIFRDSLVGNLQEIARLAPKLNLSGDPAIDAFSKEIGALTIYSPDALRESKNTRAQVATKASDLLKRLEGYKI